MRLKSKANKQRWAVQGFFLTLLLLWTFVSIWKGEIFYRMLVFGLMSLLLCVFIISMFSIRRQLRVLQDSIRQGILMNKTLLRSFLIVYSLEVFFYLGLFISLMLNQDYLAGNVGHENYTCDQLLEMCVLYALVCLFWVVRTAMVQFMAIR